MSRKATSIPLALCIACTLILTLVLPVLAQQGSQIQVSYGDGYADQPDIAIDSQGNIHIVYFYSYDGWWDPYWESREIWYTMLDNDGNTLIDDTRISADDGYDSTHPAIAIDSKDKVHILWRGSTDDDSSYQEIIYYKLDPYLDDRDGDAADASTIILVDEKELTDMDEWYTYHPCMAIDSNDDIHIAWEDYYDGIFYMKVDSNGDELVAETMVTDASAGYVWNARPDIAVDSNDNAHITWNDWNSTSNYETCYAMLDGSDGSALIDTTVLTPDDDEKSKRQSIVVDDEDMVHIVWHDYRAVDYNEIYYTKLNPGLDDQDGDSADESIISVIDDTQITPHDEDYSWNPKLALQCGYLHMAWGDAYVDEYGEVYYMALDTNGSEVIPANALTSGETVTYTTNHGDNAINIAVDDNGKAHMVWCDDRTGYDEIWYTSYQGPACHYIPIGGEAYEVNLTSFWLSITSLIVLAFSIVIIKRSRTT